MIVCTIRHHHTTSSYYSSLSQKAQKAQKDQKDQKDQKAKAKIPEMTAAAPAPSKKRNVTPNSTNNTTQVTQPQVSDTKSQQLPVREREGNSQASTSSTTSSSGNGGKPVTATPPSKAAHPPSHQTHPVPPTSAPSNPLRDLSSTGGKIESKPASGSSGPVDDERRRMLPKIKVGPGHDFWCADQDIWSRDKVIYKNGKLDLFG